MNEVTKIHLGRQAYTVSADAYHELRQYIDAIAKKIKDDDVINEIEVRMSELLTERGINADKVILPADVDFLKSQLGSPADFGDDDTEEDSQPEPSEPKKLFRDTENGMVAGVAAGLAKYFGIDTLLIRIAFIVLVFVTFGWGILLYILLWILVPEAKTPSERLKMAGKPVTVQSLKQVVEQADVKGAAHRVNTTLAGPINSLFRLILKLIGIAFVAFGLSGLLGLVTGETYFLARGKSWTQSNIFPVGFREHLLLQIAVAIAALCTIFIVLFGIAIYRRKWPIKTWITGVLVGLVFIGMAIGGALTADVVPTVHTAYDANTHSSLRTLPATFSSISVINDRSDSINFVPSDKNMIGFSYYDHPDLNGIKTTITNNILTIDESAFNWQRNCATLCFPRSYHLNITIYAPNAAQLENQTYYPYPPALPKSQVVQPVPMPLGQ